MPVFKFEGSRSLVLVLTGILRLKKSHAESI